MRNLFCLLVAGLLIFSAPRAYADMADIRSSDNAVEFKIGAEHMRYGESVNNSTFDTEEGWLPSFGLGAGMLLNNGPSIASNLFFRIDGDVSLGSVHYNGGLQQRNGPTIPYQNTNRAHIYSLDAKAGRAFEVGSMVMLTPYIDLGTRYWDRVLQGTGGYTEDYSHGEVMGGMMIQVSPFPKWVLSGWASVGTTWGANMHTNGIDYPLGSSVVWQGDAKLGYTFASNWEATGTAEVKGFNYGNSSAINGSLEPNSSTHEQTFLLGLAYHWR